MKNLLLCCLMMSLLLCVGCGKGSSSHAEPTSVVKTDETADLNVDEKKENVSADSENKDDADYSNSETKENEMDRKKLISVQFVEQDGPYAVCKDEDEVKYKIETTKFEKFPSETELVLEYTPSKLEKIDDNTYLVDDGYLGKFEKSVK